MSPISRRRLLGWTGAGAALAGVGAATGFAVGSAGAGTDAPANPGVVPFRGDHQAGIITPAQDRLHFVALDVTADNRDRLRALLQKWTTAAERMTAGAEAAPGGAVNLNPQAPPSDTGEALGLPAVVADADVRGGRVVVREGRRRPLRAGRAAPAGSRGAAELHRRPDRPRPLRRRPVHPGVFRRPAGGGARGAQPRPDGLRHHLGALVAAGVRAHLVHVAPGRPPRATCSASRTAPATSRRRTLPRSTSSCGYTPATGRRGSRAAPTWCPAGSACTSRSGTARRSPSRR